MTHTGFLGEGDPVASDPVSLDVVPERSVLFGGPRTFLHTCLVAARSSSHLSFLLYQSLGQGFSVIVSRRQECEEKRERERGIRPC